MTTDESASVAENAERHPSSDVAMTRSEEQVSVTTRTRVRERVRLVKHIVTEQVTVEVRREELRVERDAVADDGTNDDLSATCAHPEDLVIVLHEERVSVTAVPVERVRVSVENVVEQVGVSTDRRVEDVQLVVDRGTPAGG